MLLLLELRRWVDRGSWASKHREHLLSEHCSPNHLFNEGCQKKNHQFLIRTQLSSVPSENKSYHDEPRQEVVFRTKEKVIEPLEKISWSSRVNTLKLQTRWSHQGASPHFQQTHWLKSQIYVLSPNGMHQTVWLQLGPHLYLNPHQPQWKMWKMQQEIKSSRY